MKNKNSLFVGLAMVFLTASNLTAQTTLTSQPDSCYGKDAEVYYLTSVPSSKYGNYGSLNELAPVTWTVSGNLVYSRGFIDFIDLHSIPEGATINSATLYLYGPTSSQTAPQGNSGDNKSWVQRVTNPWGEFSINWDNQPSTTTSNQVAISSSTSQWSYSPIINVKQLVQDMVHLPASQRYGFCIKLQTEGTYRSIVFASSDASNSSLRPKIVVTYTYCYSDILSKSAKSTKGEIYPLDDIDDSKLKDAFPVKVTPNPSQGNFYVNYDLPLAGPVTINVISIESGRVLKTFNLDGLKGKNRQAISLNLNLNENLIVEIKQRNTTVKKIVSVVK